MFFFFCLLYRQLFFFLGTTRLETQTAPGRDTTQIRQNEPRFFPLAVDAQCVLARALITTLREGGGWAVAQWALLGAHQHQVAPRAELFTRAH